MKNIRNFSIIAHIDHGKSTLADRMLEVTNTIEKRKMREQVLDMMDLERERGITIKMQPVRMVYDSARQNLHSSALVSVQSAQSQRDSEYILNLIDTPGHIDFSYEVSRALKAVEGVVLLVDSTQGIQAQTLTVLEMAREQGLLIIPAISKIDARNARIDEVRSEIIETLKCAREDIIETSGKTGEGVNKLLNEIIQKISAPKNMYDEKKDPLALVFDFQYSNHRGVIVFVRMFNGEIKKGDKMVFKASKENFIVQEVGIFSPEEKPKDSLSSGEIGYIVTGIKRPGIASVGDSLILFESNIQALKGYQKPNPVVWASVYPESQDDFPNLRQAIELLYLSDSSLYFTEEVSGILGRGFRCGFLGMLHLEIIVERLKREFNLQLIITSPSITYEVLCKDGNGKIIYTPSLFPEYGDIVSVKEPWVRSKIIYPPEYLSQILQILREHEAIMKDTAVFGDGRIMLNVEMPLRELMRNFFEEIKRVSSGYASLSYEVFDMRDADVARMDVFVAEELIPAFSKIVSKRRIQREAKQIVEKLYKNLPKQMVKVKIQAGALGRIISSKTLSAMKKDVTGYLYGGDITRKMKLREKQKKGKKKMQKFAKADIPHDVFLKIIRSE